MSALGRETNIYKCSGHQPPSDRPLDITVQRRELFRMGSRDVPVRR